MIFLGLGVAAVVTALELVRFILENILGFPPTPAIVSSGDCAAVYSERPWWNSVCLGRLCLCARGNSVHTSLWGRSGGAQ